MLQKKGRKIDNIFLSTTSVLELTSNIGVGDPNLSKMANRPNKMEALLLGGRISWSESGYTSHTGTGL